MTNSKNKKITKRKRAYLPALHGSISLEAAVVGTMFLLIVLYLLSILLMMGTVFHKQMFFDQISKKLSKAVYYVTVADQITDETEFLKEEKEKIRKLAQESKNSGFNLQEAIYDHGYIDIKGFYPLELPFWKRFLFIRQRSRIKDWTGADISQPEQIVYITKTGTVYHKSKECSHLKLHIQRAEYREISAMRNQNGEKYTPCEKCVRGTLNEFSNLFVTTDGNRYHTTLQCSGISRYIIEISIDQVGDKKPCSECGG